VPQQLLALIGLHGRGCGLVVLQSRAQVHDHWLLVTVCVSIHALQLSECSHGMPNTVKAAAQR
jgi:hypothetical protein